MVINVLKELNRLRGEILVTILVTVLATVFHLGVRTTFYIQSIAFNFYHHFQFFIWFCKRFLESRALG